MMLDVPATCELLPRFVRLSTVRDAAMFTDPAAEMKPPRRALDVRSNVEAATIAPLKSVTPRTTKLLTFVSDAKTERIGPAAVTTLVAYTDPCLDKPVTDISLPARNVSPTDKVEPS